MNKILFFSIFLSIVLHLATYDFLSNKVKLSPKLKQSTTDKALPIGYQQIKYVKLVKPIPPKKKALKVEKRKPTIKKKSIPKKVKKIIKKESKKYIKVPKKLPVKKKVKKIKKSINKQIMDEQKLLERKKELRKLKQKVEDLNTIKKLDKQTQSYIKLYGQEYFEYSKETKKYLNNNLNNIGRVTQMYLQYPRIAIKTKQQGMNIVQFFLYPNGDIEDLKIINGSGYSTLDKNTIKTIKLAYKDYPRPEKKTKIKIYVYYSLK